MALRNISRQISTYVSDLGREYTNVPINILEGYEGIVNYPAREQLACGGSLPFQPRAIVATFPGNASDPTGDTIRFPVDRPENIPSVYTAVRQAGAVCINLDGEQWSSVPANVVGASYNTSPTTGVTARGRKGTGVYDYSSDVLNVGTGVIQDGYQYELDPLALFLARTGCLENPQDSVPCTSRIDGFQARRLISINYAARTGGGPVRSIDRTAKVSLFANILQCARDLAGISVCLRYKGETVLNLQNLL